MLTLQKSTAKKLYPDVPEWFKKELHEVFGEACFKPKNFESILSFDDACVEVGESPRDEKFHIGEIDEIAYKKLKVVARAINNGWLPDWNNNNQKKWYPYFNLSSGFGFSGADYYYDFSDAGVGSRLCFESEEKAKFAGNQFLNLYEELLTIKTK